MTSGLIRIVLMLFPAFGMTILSQGTRAQESRNNYNLLLLSTSIDARNKLSQSCQLLSNEPIRQVLNNVTRQFGTATWLDRRVDPSQIAIMRKSETSFTLGDELSRLATSCGIQGGLIENVYMMAPANQLARIQRSAVVLHGQIASRQKSLAESAKPLQWIDITSSNELLQTICSNWNVQVDGLELPHDLYHSGKLPKCSLATQLALLLGPFDLQATLDSNHNFVKLKIEPLSSRVSWEDSYESSFSESNVKALAKRYPESTAELVRTDLFRVRGETNLHIDILTPRRRDNKTKLEHRWTFN